MQWLLYFDILSTDKLYRCYCSITITRVLGCVTAPSPPLACVCRLKGRKADAKSGSALRVIWILGVGYLPRGWGKEGQKGNLSAMQYGYTESTSDAVIIIIKHLLILIIPSFNQPSPPRLACIQNFIVALEYLQHTALSGMYQVVYIPAEPFRLGRGVFTHNNVQHYSYAERLIVVQNRPGIQISYFYGHGYTRTILLTF